MKLVLKLVFPFIIMCLFSQVYSAQKQDEDDCVSKIKNIRVELVRSFQGMSLEERYRIAVLKRKEMEKLLFANIKNIERNEEQKKILYNEIMLWKGIVNNSISVSREKLMTDEYLSELEKIKENLLMAPWDIASHFSNEKKMDELYEKKTEIEKRLLNSASYPSKDFTLIDICKKLNEDDLFIDYYRVENNEDPSYIVFLLTSEKCVPEMKILENGKNIDRSILDLELSIANRDAAEFFSAKLDKVAEFIWYPVAENAKNMKRILISPDSFITGVPFNVLRDQDKKFLVEKYDIVHLLNAASIFKNKSDNSKLTVMGNAQLSILREGANKLYSNELSSCSWYYPEEMESFSPVFKAELSSFSPEYLTKDSFTMKNVILKLKNKGVLYIDSPDFSKGCNDYSVVLNVKNEIMEYVGKDVHRSMFINEGFWTSEGFIMAEDILYSGFQEGNAVILSFSQGFGKNFIDGESRTGAGAAFLIAGAGSVVASPWEMPMILPDNILLKYLFYFNSGEDEETALAMSQRDFLKKNLSSHPLEWGSIMVLK